MAKLTRARNTTKNLFKVFLTNSTNGLALTNLNNASTNLAICLFREYDSVGTLITGAHILSITTIGTWVDPGAGNIRFKAVDVANAPGFYEIQVPDSWVALGSGDRTLTGAVFDTGSGLNLLPCPFEVDLTKFDLQADITVTLGGMPVTLLGLLANSLDFKIRQGIAYNYTGALATWTFTGIADITGRTINFVDHLTGTVLAAGSILSSGGNVQQVSLPLTSTQTAAFAANTIYEYSLQAASGGDVRELATGRMEVLAHY